jgi:hypothetical protein
MPAVRSPESQNRTPAFQNNPDFTWRPAITEIAPQKNQQFMSGLAVAAQKLQPCTRKSTN